MEVLPIYIITGGDNMRREYEFETRCVKATTAIKRLYKNISNTDMDYTWAFEYMLENDLEVFHPFEWDNGDGGVTLRMYCDEYGDEYIYSFTIVLEEKEEEKEEEKAVQLKFNNDKYGYLLKWIPLSDLYTVEEINKAQQAASSGVSYNIMLLNFAKDHGIKGIRKGMRTQTILLKIQQAGLEAPQR